MKTAELMDHIATEAGIDKKNAKKVISAFLEGVIASVKNGEEVMLPGFGKFAMKDTPARQGRNPATGEPIEIPAGRRFTFMAAKAVREALQAPTE